MQATNLVRSGSRPSTAQVVLVVAGAIHLLTGLALMLAPEWFFANVGTFPPYNRHYAGDLGAFQIALGVGLLAAVRDPARHRLLVGVIAAGNLLHTLNHAYDAFMGRAALLYWLADSGPLLVMTLALALVAAGLLDRE